LPAQAGRLVQISTCAARDGALKRADSAPDKKRGRAAQEFGEDGFLKLDRGDESPSRPALKLRSVPLGVANQRFASRRLK
jgi:hypothetical protein